MKLGEIRRNVQAENDGVWVKMTGGWAACVRSISNPDARRLNQRHTQRNMPVYRKSGLPDIDVADQQMLELLVETCLTDWKGLEDDSGNEIPFSKETAYEILGDPQYREMLDDIATAANSAETFRIQGRDADLNG